MAIREPKKIALVIAVPAAGSSARWCGDRYETTVQERVRILTDNERNRRTSSLSGTCRPASVSTRVMRPVATVVHHRKTDPPNEYICYLLE